MSRVPTAEQTKQCPPHHWFIDSKNKGTCVKCPATCDFAALQPRPYPRLKARAQASAGGKKNLGKIREKKEEWG